MLGDSPFIELVLEVTNAVYLGLGLSYLLFMGFRLVKRKSSERLFQSMAILSATIVIGYTSSAAALLISADQEVRIKALLNYVSELLVSESTVAIAGTIGLSSVITAVFFNRSKASSGRRSDRQ